MSMLIQPVGFRGNNPYLTPSSLPHGGGDVGSERAGMYGPAPQTCPNAAESEPLPSTVDSLPGLGSLSCWKPIRQSGWTRGMDLTEKNKAHRELKASQHTSKEKPPGSPVKTTLSIHKTNRTHGINGHLRFTQGLSIHLLFSTSNRGYIYPNF